MNVGLYVIINNPLPELLKIKDFEVEREVFEYTEDIIDFLNENLLLDKMDSENVVALSLTHGLIPRGILLNGIGSNERCTPNFRGLAIGLLLTGAEQFMVIHNHPGGNKNPSKSDALMSVKYRELGETIGIDFSGHIMVTQDCFVRC